MKIVVIDELKEFPRADLPNFPCILIIRVPFRVAYETTAYNLHGKKLFNRHGRFENGGAIVCVQMNYGIELNDEHGFLLV